MPDPKTAKFRDFYPDDFGQFLSGLTIDLIIIISLSWAFE